MILIDCEKRLSKIILVYLKRREFFNFGLTFVTIDSGKTGFDCQHSRHWLSCAKVNSGKSGIKN